MSRRRAIWNKLRTRKDRKRIEYRHGKRCRTMFIPRPDSDLLEDIESSFRDPPPKE